MKKVFIILCVISLLFFGCKKSSTFSSIPEVSFISLSPLLCSWNNYDASQAPVLSFQLRDAEGDFDFQSGGDSSFVYLKNTSVYDPGDSLYKYEFPDLSGLSNKADMDVKVQVLLNNLKPSGISNQIDSFYFDIWVEDLAGHKSNVIHTPEPLIFQ